MAKKARSAKQRANDKRLGAMAKARAAAKKNPRAAGRRGKVTSGKIYGPTPVPPRARRKPKKATHKPHAHGWAGKAPGSNGGKRGRRKTGSGNMLVVTKSGEVGQGHIATAKQRERALRKQVPVGGKSARLARAALGRPPGKLLPVVLPGYMRRKRSRKG